MTIDIPREFSREPVGRYVADGPSSGEVFRLQKLLPALAEAETVTLLLDGAEGYGSSFLDEAFAGLLRNHEFTEKEFQRRIRLVSDEDPSLLVEINGYVADEQRRKA